MTTAPRLTVSIPTFQRPDFAARAVLSITSASQHPAADQVQIVVSDNSTDQRTEHAVSQALASWPGPTHYQRHDPSVGMIGNFNRCIDLATGQWVQILHDDDYLLPGGLERILARLPAGSADLQALLFGVHVVSNSGKILRRQVPRRQRVLAPEAALRRHLTWSSYVRFPAIVVAREAYAGVGCFDDSVGAATDLDMWSRVFAAFGVRLEPIPVVAYVIHEEAATESMFTDQYVQFIAEVFDRAATLRVLPETQVRQAQAHWFNQFVIAGTIRRLRARDWSGATGPIGLFEHEAIAALPTSWRWLPLRVAVQLTTSLAESRFKGSNSGQV